MIAGWITTEVGRQPYTVYGLLRTAESASPIEAAAVASSLVAFAVVYFAVFGAGAFYMLRLMAQAHRWRRQPDCRRRADARQPASCRGRSWARRRER